MAVFGGAPIRTQQAQLRQGGQVVVGTVGRVLDLISRHSLMLHSCRYIVLDEADEMLDLGFLEDVEKILGLAPGSRQTALFSATMPTEIRRLAERHLYDPVTVQVKAATLTIDTVEQFYVETKPQEKLDSLVRVLEAERPQQAIVFTRTKIRCEQLFQTLKNQGMNVKALHGDMSQGSRDGVMINFKGGRTTILVATDVAARGLDISTVTHIVNYDVPTSPDVYVHRIGRTGRVGRSGRAITFVEPRQRRDLEAIERHASTSIAPWVEGAHVAPDARLRAAPAPPPQAARRADHQRHRLREADRQRRPPRGRRGRRPDRRDDRRTAWTASASATSACSSASRSSRCRSTPRPRSSQIRGRDSGTRTHSQLRRPRRMSTATMSTNHGDITFELYDEDAPKTVENFRTLAENGYYDGLIVPPHHPRLHDPGRLPAGHRHRRPGLRVRGRDQRAQGHPRRARDGQRRPEHERLAVLHRHRPPRRRGWTASTPCSAA